MHLDLQTTRDQFVERMGFLGTLFGFSKLVGQIYGCLYLSPGPLTLDDLVATLQVSKGAVSTNIRELEKWGGCKKVWVKGDRKDYYEAETQLKTIINKRLMDALKRRIDTVKDVTESSRDLVDRPGDPGVPNDASLRQFYRERLNRLERVRKKLELIINTASRII